MEDGSPVTVLPGHDEWIEGLCQGPGGRVVTWSFDHTVRSWEPARAEATLNMDGHTDHVKTVMALPDGRLVSWSWDRTTRLWDPETGVPIACWESAGDLLGVYVYGP